MHAQFHLTTDRCLQDIGDTCHVRDLDLTILFYVDAETRFMHSRVLFVHLILCFVFPCLYSEHAMCVVSSVIQYVPTLYEESLEF